MPSPICDHDDCLTLVTGPTHSGTTILAAVLIECGLEPLPEVGQEMARQPRFGLEGRFKQDSRDYTLSITAPKLHWGQRIAICEKIKGYPARLLKSPTVSEVLPDFLDDVPRVKHVIVCWRRLADIVARWVQRHRYESEPAEEAIMRRYRACHWASQLFHGRVAFGDVWYPEDYQGGSAAAGPIIARKLERAGLRLDPEAVGEAVRELWKPEWAKRDG